MLPKDVLRDKFEVLSFPRGGGAMKEPTYTLTVQRMQEEYIGYLLKAHPGDGGETLRCNFQSWNEFEKRLLDCTKRLAPGGIITHEELIELQTRVDKAGSGIAVFKNNLIFGKSDTFCILGQKNDA
jgi:hypothetical protein